MKKLEKLTLKELSREVATIGSEEAQGLNGGYTVADMENMMASGTWTGGQVDGMGYVGGVNTVGMTSQLNYGTVGSLMRTTGDDYSDVALDALLSGLSGSNPATAVGYAVVNFAFDVGQVAWDNATDDAVEAVLRQNGIGIDSNISWSTENNTLKVWDQCGNLIYSF